MKYNEKSMPCDFGEIKRLLQIKQARTLMLCAVEESMKNFKTKPVSKAPALPKDKEQLIIDPPYIMFGYPSIPTSQSIIMKVGGLRKILDELNDEDSLRIEWFAGFRATEYSVIPHK